jgi:hypothetical protein
MRGFYESRWEVGAAREVVSVPQADDFAIAVGERNGGLATQIMQAALADLAASGIDYVSLPEPGFRDDARIARTGLEERGPTRAAGAPRAGPAWLVALRARIAHGARDLALADSPILRSAAERRPFHWLDRAPSPPGFRSRESRGRWSSPRCAPRCPRTAGCATCAAPNISPGASRTRCTTTASSPPGRTVGSPAVLVLRSRAMGQAPDRARVHRGSGGAMQRCARSAARSGARARVASPSSCVVGARSRRGARARCASAASPRSTPRAAPRGLPCALVRSNARTARPSAMADRRPRTARSRDLGPAHARLDGGLTFEARLGPA